MKLAATDTQQVNTLAGTDTSQSGGSDPIDTTGTFQVKLKPSPLIGLTTTVPSTTVSEILSSTADYTSVAGPASEAYNGAKWTEIPLAEATGGPETLGWDSQDAQMTNPVAQVQLLATSDSVTQAGTHVVNGVKTTEYTGTVSVSTALSTLPSGLSNALAEPLHYVTDISFAIWIDRQNLVRKITEDYTSQGVSEVSTINVTAVNGPVTVAVPPASEVYVYPASQINSNI